MAGDYEIIQAVHIGDREIVVGENQADEQGLPYLVAYYESNAILGRYYDAIELYTIQRYLQYDTLQEMGLIHFDDWASDFGETITAIELSPEGYNLVGR